MAFVAGLGWRKQGWTEDNPVSKRLAQFWIVLQPLLFGLIGTEIRVFRFHHRMTRLGDFSPNLTKC
jgi:hypothetical protein